MNAPAILARPVRPIARPRSIAAGLLWHSGCHCPGCGHQQWNVGRVTAECAVCATALIIALETDGDQQWQNA